jgi:hypothetical protein
MRAVEMKWRGKTYTIPASAVFDAVLEVEEIITLGAIGEMHDPVKRKIGKVAQAYGSMLRSAGCKVADVTVFEAISPGGEKEMESAVDAIAALVSLLLAGAPKSSGEAPGKTSAS